MAANTRFAVSVHCLLALAYVGQDGSTAELLAGSVHTNAVVVRRILKQLERYGLVEVRPGKGGGVRLTRAPEDITLDMVYAAVTADGDGIFALHGAGANAGCVVSCGIEGLLEPVFSEASRALVESLSQTSLADLRKRLHPT